MGKENDLHEPKVSFLTTLAICKRKSNLRAFEQAQVDSVLCKHGAGKATPKKMHQN